MKTFVYSLLSMLIPLCSVAQEVARTPVVGQIKAPEGEDLEGISVYNVSAQRGTITDRDGTFTLSVAVNDRVLFTAIQFQEFTVIVDEGIVASGEMNVFVNPSVVTLEEVVVRPYDLSGNIVVDSKRIRYSEFYSLLGDKSTDYVSREFLYAFAPDDQSTIRRNYSMEALGYLPQHEGADFLGLFGVLGTTLFANNNQRPPKKRAVFKKESGQLSDAKVMAVRQRFPTHYFTDSLKIPQPKIMEFLYFTEDESLPTDLLKEENELKLRQLLQEKSEAYLDLMEE